MTAIAEKKVSGHRSYQVATRLQSFNRPNMISMRLRRLYLRLSYLMAFLRDFRPGGTNLYFLVFQRVSQPVGIIAPIGQYPIRLRQRPG